MGATKGPPRRLTQRFFKRTIKRKVLNLKNELSLHNKVRYLKRAKNAKIQGREAKHK
ncbi:hypothetical protein LguiA_030240 [Lonicera macranthoides]